MSVQREDIINAVQGTAGLFDFLRRLGFSQPTQKGRDWGVLCPFHDDHSPSCLWTDKFGGGASGGWSFKCYSCGAGGGVIDFAGQVLRIDPNQDFNGLMEKLGGVLGVAGRETPLSDAEIEARRAERERKEQVATRRAESERAESIAEATELWREAAAFNTSTERRTAVTRYLASRGINIDELENGLDGLAYFRWHPEVPRNYFEALGAKPDGSPNLVQRFERVPALVLGCISHAKKLTGIQRIYLDPPPPRGKDGGGKISYGLDGDGGAILVKATKGSMMGRARNAPRGSTRGGVTCRLNRPTANTNGTLILCEGADGTAPALLRAVTVEGIARAVVWACISADGLRSFRLGQDEATWVRRVIVAGDYDKSKTGQKAAKVAGGNLLAQLRPYQPAWPREAYEAAVHGGWDYEAWKSWGGADDVEVRIALPGEVVAPELVKRMMEAA